MKTPEQVDAIMQRLPLEWRKRWCAAYESESGCACMGCVQVGCRALMFEVVAGRPYRGDPERIDESRIAPAVREQFRPTRDEWAAWRARKEAGRAQD
jgi:hypothetical protein